MVPFKESKTNSEILIVIRKECEDQIKEKVLLSLIKEVTIT